MKLSQTSIFNAEETPGQITDTDDRSVFKVRGPVYLLEEK